MALEGYNMKQHFFLPSPPPTSYCYSEAVTFQVLKCCFLFYLYSWQWILAKIKLSYHYTDG